MRRLAVILPVIVGAAALSHAQTDSAFPFSLDGKYRYIALFDKPIAVSSLYTFNNIDIHAVKTLRLDFSSSLVFDSLGIPVSKLQQEIFNYNKGFIASIKTQNIRMLRDNKTKLTPQSLSKPEMRGIAVEAIEGQRRAKSFANMSANDPSIYALVFSATPNDRARLQAAFPGVQFVKSESSLRMPLSISAIQERYQSGYTRTINQHTGKPDFELYRQLKKVASGFYGVELN